MFRRLLIPLAALPFVVATAAPAQAAITVDYSTLINAYDVNGDGEDDVITVACSEGEISPAPDTPVPCAEVELISVDPGLGHDTVDLSGITPEAFPELRVPFVDTDEPDLWPDTVIGSSGADMIRADEDDHVSGGGGPDYFEGGRLVQGGEGADVFKDVHGTQGAFGGPGDDRFVNSITAAGIDGGAGDDTFSLDVESVWEGQQIPVVLGAATLTIGSGFPGEEPFPYPVTGMEHARLTLPGVGTQSLDASAFPGDLDVWGFGGTDTLIGTMKADTLRGGNGADIIDAQDGGVDYVDCGDGADLVKADVADQLVGCETIEYAEPPATPAPETSALSGPARVKKGAIAKFRFTSSVPGSVFQCRLDSRRWRACASPRAIRTKRLALGHHALRVRAGYPTGKWDPTPSVKHFRVTRQTG